MTVLKVKENCVCSHVDNSDGSMCDAREPSLMNYGCTRIKGHAGEHIACGISNHLIAAWENKGDSK